MGKEVNDSGKKELETLEGTFIALYLLCALLFILALICLTIDVKFSAIFSISAATVGLCGRAFRAIYLYLQKQ